MQTGSNTLVDSIRQEITAAGGALSFARFMELALYHPEFGYYNSADFALGQHGDFTTAPEISPLFAQCFARQCQQIVNRLGAASILELGAGTGRFAADLLRSLDTMDCLPEHYYIYEISLGLRKKQQHFLQSSCPKLADRVTWLDHLPEHFTGIIIANEVLDALPIHRFRIEADGISECCVAWENNQFVWKNITSPTPALTAKANDLRITYGLHAGYESEINLALPTFIKAIATTLTQGVILFVDYGYGEREYYHPQRSKGTLTCFQQHRRHDNPLIYPGKQDITAHVDFTSVISTAADDGCTLAGYTTQASFLLACGLMDIAAEVEKELSPTAEFKLHQAIKLLTLPTEMGEVIKVMGIGKNIDIPLIGFSLLDRSRDLSA